MSNIAVFPGSFDPVTLGHEDILRRALPLFDEIIVAIGENSTKQYMFSLEQRKQWLIAVFSGEAKVKVESYEGLTINFCQKVGARYIIRGLRSAADFEFEQNIAQMNRDMARDIETIFIPASPKHSAINSTIVRDIIRNGGDASAFVPAGIELK